MKDLQLLNKYYADAQTQKSSIASQYSLVQDYTDVTTQENSGYTNKKTVTFREVDEVVSSSIQDLNNFLMQSMFARGDKWASLKINETVYKNVNGLITTNDTQSKINIKDINENLESNIDTTFTYINESNFYTEISRSLRDALNLGTGCIKVIKQDSITKPFAYRYISTNMLYFLTNVQDEFTYTFKKICDVNKGDLLRNYSGYNNLIIPSDFQEEGYKCDIIESVRYSEEDKVYTFTVSDSGFNDKILEVELNYNPYIIFRWNLEGDQPWGVGIGIKGLPLFKRLRDSYELRRKQAKKIVNPPMKASGDKALLAKLDLGDGKVNYGGEGTGMPSLNGDADSFNIESIYTTQTLMPLDQDIAQDKADIQDLYMSNPLGNVEDYKNRSATETQARLNMMRTRWAVSFELIQEELLEVVLKSAYIIMLEKQLIVQDIEGFEAVSMNFINELSKLKEQEKVNNIVNYIQVALNASQYAQETGLKTDKVLKYIADQYNIPEDLRLGADEILALEQQKAQFRAQQLAQAQLDNQGQQGGEEFAEQTGL